MCANVIVKLSLSLSLSLEKRKTNKFIVNSARTERYLKSSIPKMQRMLNKHERQLRNIYVTNEIYPCGSLVEKI